MIGAAFKRRRTKKIISRNSKWRRNTSSRRFRSKKQRGRNSRGGAGGLKAEVLIGKEAEILMEKKQEYWK